MKQFFQQVLATIVGLVILGAILTILSIVSLAGMAAMGSAAPNVTDNTVLVINLNGAITERSQANPFAQLLSSSASTPTALEDILKAVDRAKTDDRIKGIYIQAGTLTDAAPATLQAIRNALADFKSSGKFILSYGDNYSQGAYYVCSIADTVSVNPQGLISWSGLASQTMYYKDLFEKLGVSMQVVKVGTYKSAVEPFLLSEMSDANRLQLTVYNSEVWSAVTRDVAKSRHITAEKLNQLADSAIFFSPGDIYVREHLADKTAYSDDVPNMIAAAMKVDSPSDYNTVSPADLAALADNEPKSTSGNVIAVYYAVGNIVDQPSSGVTNAGNPEIVSTTVINDLKKLADDDDVKAVVLRVNSGGGSAFASEQIWHQVVNIRSRKPIIVSMGDYAASGGYYISCAANWIVAEPTTLTGSIGIFGTFPEAEKLMNETLGIHVSTVTTNKYSDFGSSFSRKFTDDERDILQRYINRGYDLFTRRCADGRHISQDSIKAIGEGRIWTGTHALSIGLVDQLGGLKDAIAVAKKKAKVDDCTLLTYPAQQNIIEQLMQSVNGTGTYADQALQQALGDAYSIVKPLRNVTQRTGIQASLPFYLRWNL